jgi:hypothetical protein
MTADNNARSTQVTTWRATLNGRGMPPGGEEVSRKGAKAQRLKKRSAVLLCVFAPLREIFNKL